MLKIISKGLNNQSDQQIQESSDLLKTGIKKPYSTPSLTVFEMEATAGNANLSTDQLQTGS